MANQEQFFRALGTKVRTLRKERGYSQEDMLSFGTVSTLLRICEVFETPLSQLVRKLDEGVYEKLDDVPDVAP